MSSSFPSLTNDEFEIEPSENYIILRHIHPKARDGDKIQSWAFAPNPKDFGKMSVTQKDLVDLKSTYSEYTEKYSSIGMWGLSTQEVSDIGSRTIDDQSTKPSPPKGHAYIDYRDISLIKSNSKNSISRAESKRAKRLRDIAIKHGCIFPNS